MNFDPYDEVLFSNFSYDPEVYYFLYLGDIKNYTLNILFKECLQNNIRAKNIQFIAIVPDIFSQYDYDNIIVINPAISKDSYSMNAANEGTLQQKISLRVGTASFMAAVSNSPAIQTLIKKILKQQENLFLYLWESVPEMLLDTIEGVKIVGPDKKLAQKFNNKIVQYRSLKPIVPLAEHCFCKDIDELLKRTEKLRDGWQGKIFISCAYSAAGANAVITENQQEVLKWCDNREGEFLISRYIPHNLDPTVLAVVANEKDVYIAGVADQVIEGGRRFIGSTYPSVVTPNQRKLLHEYTIKVGRMLGRNGYRGIFGCDYIIDHKGDIYFIEINARKQGTTVEFCFTLEQLLPDGSPMLPELEYCAVMENSFPENTIELQQCSGKIHWGTYNYKLHDKRKTIDHIPHSHHERKSFQKAGMGNKEKDYVILEHIGDGFTVMEGTFLARVVSVSNNRKDMQKGLQHGVTLIKKTINEA
jgi:hypothetical protein